MGHSKIKTTERYILLNEDDFLTRPTSLGYLNKQDQEKKTIDQKKSKKLSDLIDRFAKLMEKLEKRDQAIIELKRINERYLKEIKDLKKAVNILEPRLYKKIKIQKNSDLKN